MNTIKILNRWTDDVLFECETPESLESGLHMRHALGKAVSSRADLSGANLSGANLIGAKWRGITITRAPLQLWGLRWLVTFIDEHMQIGCQIHPLADWAAFDDAAIAAMDGRDALRFWRANKAALFALAAADGRWGQQ